MIEIKVEDYCQNCPEFDPGVEAETLYFDGYDTERLTTVFCVHRRRCEAIAKSLKKHLLAEMKGVMVTDAESDQYEKLEEL